MKNLKILMALLAALALVFAGACSDGGDTTLHYEILSDGWIVYTAEGLQEWATAVESNISLNCKLGANIDMQGASWTPVESYSGTFDGDGHKVSNFAINLSASMVGFFGALNGTVTGLGLENATVTSTLAEYVGGIAGHNRSNGSITACYSTGSVEATDASSYAGGIAGRNYNSTIAACYYTNADDGVGMDVDNSAETTLVDGSSGKTWADAESAMNEAIGNLSETIGWEYTGGGNNATDAPTLKKSDS